MEKLKKDFQKEVRVSMAALNCSVTNCGYNNDNYCCRGDITVGGKCACNSDDTCCESFRDRQRDSYMNALDRPCKTISIDCEASNCMYNKDLRCHAEHVDIRGCGTEGCRETLCATFKEK